MQARHDGNRAQWKHPRLVSVCRSVPPRSLIWIASQRVAKELETKSDGFPFLRRSGLERVLHTSMKNERDLGRKKERKKKE